MKKLKNILVLSAGLVVASSSVMSLSTPLVSATASGNTHANGNLAFASKRGSGNTDVDIYTQSPDGFTPAVDISNTSGTTYEGASSWSPDGTKLAYTVNVSGNIEIYTMNADGSNQINVTNNAADDSDPSWSPDGTKITFTTNRGASSNDEIFVMNADGSNQANITNNVNDDFGPSWSPDGTKIAFGSNRDGNNEIYKMNTDGTGVVRLMTSALSDSSPSWSPDGTKIAFTSLRDGNSEIYSMNADGTNQTNLTNDPGTDQIPAWSPDGTQIAFTSTRDGHKEIYVMAADGSYPYNLSQTSDPNDVNDFVSWQPVLFPATVNNGDGTSTTTVPEDQSFMGADYTVANQETLVVDGIVNNITVQSGGTLKGHGYVGTVTVQSGGHLAPGNSPGCIGSFDLAMNSGSVLDEEIGGAATACTNYDQMQVIGTVDVTGATLNTSLYGGFVPSAGQTFTIIDNDGSDAVTGTFNGLAQGATFTASGVTYTISYTGGDGNDVVLIVTSVNAAVAAGASAPKTPNTGFALVSAHPLATLLFTSAAALMLVSTARRLKPAVKR